VCRAPPLFLPMFPCYTCVMRLQKKILELLEVEVEFIGSYADIEKELELSGRGRIWHSIQSLRSKNLINMELIRKGSGRNPDIYKFTLVQRLPMLYAEKAEYQENA